MISTSDNEHTRAELAAALDKLARLVREGVPGCSEASVTVLHDGTASTISASHERARVVDEAQYRSGDGPCLAAIRDRAAVSVTDYATDVRWPQVAVDSLHAGIHSSLSLPLMQRGRVLGGLNMYGDRAAAFGVESRRVGDSFARRARLLVAYLAELQTAWARSQRDHEVIATLQRSLLPTLPRIPGITAAARYLVSGAAAQVGGDWYDLFTLPDGSIGAAIGDVMGHDLAAAAAMGQLRSVLRSYAYEGSSPSTVLDRMDRLVQDFHMAEVATAIYGRLLLGNGSGTLTFCNAGHLPPLIRDPDGHVRRLDRGTHHLIGVLPPGASPRGEAAVTLAPGSLILLYTDGLVETRTRHYDDGINELAATLTALDHQSSPEQVCDALIDAMILTPPDDDVALLALQIGLLGRHERH